ncbi:Lsr2 family protein [Kocuria palustris]|uniref:histone-like nucleoid-structuring protein Lsr2 n=1 Tax=Kocuria palustris TaxID=71999 RepID=UPI0009ECDF55|nr:Lsr2 family protein [Kocuria palustris]
MAQKVQILLEDDIDGGAADETIRFGLDGKNYEIDLSQSNADSLREALHPFLNAARAQRSSTERRSGPHSAPGSKRSMQENKQIRQWARDNGYEIGDRGRIHGDILQAYEEAQKPVEKPVAEAEPQFAENASKDSEAA